MLTNLHIKNFLLIDELELNFQNGLTVITGETGSGKSITVDALLLVFGAKGSSEYVRNGSNQLLISAEFETTQQSILTWLEANSLLDADNPSYLNCRRVIDLSGKSKSYVNGVIVNQSVIRELGDLLLDVHTQHASIMLSKTEHQRFLLDEFAKLSDHLIVLSKYYDNYIELNQALNQARTEIETITIKKQLLEDKVADLLELDLNESEWEDLEEEHKILSNTKDITTYLNELTEIIDNDDVSIISLASRFEYTLSKMSNIIDTKNLELLANALSAELSEITHELNQLGKKVNIDPERLELVESRVDKIYAISRKHRLEPQDMYSKLAVFQDELQKLEQMVNVDILEDKLNKAQAQYMSLAKDISKTRCSIASTLSNKVSELLVDLSIKGSFQVQVKPDITAISKSGIDKIEYLISFNKGIELKPLAKVASGGELSRVALAIYAVLSIHNPPEVIIFDEIDVGIGGITASVVGKLLQDLGRFKQVICITHQPQTAAKGDHHLLVSKREENQQTKTEISYIVDMARVTEIARMIAGDVINDTAIAHATSMLM